ncbi:MAG: hypothetical protein QNK04_23905 [Myxococcota bacterium]|nr:hypothetical protein [Myxococcota bacterium]
MRARRQHAAFLPTFAGLLAILVVPVLHGSLSHGHAPCAETDAHHEACLEGDSHPDLGSESEELCPLCLAAGRSRTALPALGALAFAAVPVSAGRVVPHEAPARVSPARRTPSAPRAPPHLV